MDSFVELFEYFQMTAQSEGTTEAGCMCIGSGTISCVFRINKLGFVPGEPVIIYAEIHNDSDSRVKFTEVSLVQVIFSLKLKLKLIENGIITIS